MNREIRRRTDVVGVFLDRDSVTRLVGAVLAEQHDEWAEVRRYLGLDVLARAATVGTTPTTSQPGADSTAGAASPELGAASGFADVSVFPCPPVAHGVKSAARLQVWRVASGLMKVALAAETGQLRGHLVTQNVVAVMRKARCESVD